MRPSRYGRSNLHMNRCGRENRAYGSFLGGYRSLKTMRIQQNWVNLVKMGEINTKIIEFREQFFIYCVRQMWIQVYMKGKTQK